MPPADTLSPVIFFDNKFVSIRSLTEESMNEETIPFNNIDAIDIINYDYPAFMERLWTNEIYGNRLTTLPPLIVVPDNYYLLIGFKQIGIDYYHDNASELLTNNDKTNKVPFVMVVKDFHPDSQLEFLEEIEFQDGTRLVCDIEYYGQLDDELWIDDTDIAESGEKERFALERSLEEEEYWRCWVNSYLYIPISDDSEENVSPANIFWSERIESETGSPTLINLPNLPNLHIITTLEEAQEFAKF
jgi:hypothetical protein